MYCCNEMEYHASNQCDVHANRFDCPDCLIHRNPETGRYGLIVHDGGESYIEIRFCPWCGKQLNHT